MERKIKIILTDVCCSNGKKFCEICPCQGGDCIEYTESELLEAIKDVIKYEIHSK